MNALDAYLEQVRDRVAADGFAVQHVGGEPGALRYSYTVGLTADPSPEYWISGLLPLQAHGVLADAVRATREHGPLTGRVLLDWSVPFIVRGPVALDEAAVYTATALYPPPTVVAVSQILWPDAAGRYPDEDLYDAAGFPQVLLGLRGETL